MTSKKFEQWVQLAARHKELTEYTFKVEGGTNKEDGYLSNITFVTVTGKNKLGLQENIPLAIKASKESDVLRKVMPLNEVFVKEIFIYNRVLVEFDAFQKQVGEQNFLNYMSKCYATEVLDDREVLIMENLKLQGYTVCDRQQHLTFEHLRLILEAYGRWHAFSLASKNKKPTIFEKLKAENDINGFSFWILKTGIVDVLFNLYDKARRGSNISVSEQEKAYLTKDEVGRAVTDLFYENPSDHVILHGDGWTNNFMFQTQKNNTKPKSVRILDWQCSGFGSPVFDLSYVLYNCCDTVKYKNVKELLKIYHTSLSECLNYLGCKTDEIFSFDKLLQHWRKYSCYGLIMSAFILRFSLCDSEDAPDYAEAVEKGMKFADVAEFPMSKDKEYLLRMSDNLLHYLANLD